ncbi:MAG TPA: hypothetical protein PLC28_13390 [Spirochaetota bacterium]|nr:hypothetical protein [Spirochaetota bacterium]HPC41903.1 hypothetical protein [Spirochaetota bacterium]HPL17167.1 hypothetical protein [Spirochaetota bacterium]HRS76989.1 hypothetical protein [Spirochaetota bacterium]HRT75864.1 hypothetical protein [Spirochaetota bacterium]
MLSKKTATETSSVKVSVLKGKKKKQDATFDFSGFQDEIRVRAFYNYQERVKNNLPGNEMTDWLEAEKSLASKGVTH